MYKTSRKARRQRQLCLEIAPISTFIPIGCDPIFAEAEDACGITNIQQLDNNRFFVATNSQSLSGQTFYVEYDFDSGLSPEVRVSDQNSGKVIHTGFFDITGDKICDYADKSRCYSLYNSEGEVDLTEYTKYLFIHAACAKKERSAP